MKYKMVILIVRLTKIKWLYKETYKITIEHSIINNQFKVTWIIIIKNKIKRKLLAVIKNDKYY